MVTALTVSNNILRRAFDENIPVSPMKLQKLVYFTYKRYLQEYGNRIFNEPFEAWKYGPVVVSVYYQFNKYGSKRVKDYFRDNNRDVWEINESKSNEFASSLNYVWNEYKGYNGIDLSSLTHKRDTAWFKTISDHRRFIEDKDIKNEAWYK